MPKINLPPETTTEWVKLKIDGQAAHQFRLNGMTYGTVTKIDEDCFLSSDDKSFHKIGDAKKHETQAGLVKFAKDWM